MDLNQPSLLSPNNQSNSNASNSAIKGPSGQQSQSSNQALYGGSTSNEVALKLNGMNNTNGFGSTAEGKHYQLGGVNGNPYGAGREPAARLGLDAGSNALTVNKRLPKEETVVFFRGVTWMRDSHGLFDYESRNISKKNLKTKYVGKIVRQQNTIEFISPTQRIEDLPGYKQEEFLTLAQIKQDNKGFYIEHGDQNSEEESIDRLWLVVRSLKNPEGKFDYKIKKFDAIKVGRVRFRVKDFRCEQMNLTTKELFNQELKEAQSVKTKMDFKEEDQVQCRFCWSSDETSTNPLILACKCRGSVGLIHFECLKQWIKTQGQKKEYCENVTSYYWKKFECEICKQSYPYIFKKGHDLFKLIDIEEPKPDTKYILLESMPLDKNTSRNIHMLTVTDKKTEFKLGRGHESEVRINDISVSRCHAIIKCRKDGFYVEDNLSKFGTIVLLKNTLRLAEDHTMAVQVGRSVVSFTIKNIDVDRKMREKLKREIAPLLSCNKNKNLALLNGSSKANQEEKKEVKPVPVIDLNGDDIDLPNAATTGEQKLAVMTAAVGLGSGGGEISRRGTEIEQFGGMRNTGIANDYRTANNHLGTGTYGATHGSNIHQNASNMNVRDVDGSQSKVSRSALVNSGNAAILGHSNGLNSFKLNSNNNNLGGGPAALGGAYGAIGANHGLLGPTERERERSMAAVQPQLSRENIFNDLPLPQGSGLGAHHLGGPSRINGAQLAQRSEIGGAGLNNVQNTGVGHRSSSYANRAPASSHGGHHSAQRSHNQRQVNLRSRE